MSWDHVLTGMAGRNPEMFAAVKGGVLAFSKSLARSVAPRVRVNVVAPGWIETAFGDGVDEAAHRRVAESDADEALGNARGCGRRRCCISPRRPPRSSLERRSWLAAAMVMS